MKRLIFAVMVVLLAAGTALADNGNHYGWRNKPHDHPGRPAGSSANALSIASQWQGQIQGQSVQVGSPTIGPISIGTQSLTGGNQTVEVGGATVPSQMAVKSQLLEIPLVGAVPPMEYRGTYKPTAMAKMQPWFTQRQLRGEFKVDLLKDWPKSGKVTIGASPKAEPVKYFYVRDVRDRQESESEWDFVARLEREQAVPPDKAKEETVPEYLERLAKRGETLSSYAKRLQNRRVGMKISDGICESGNAQDNPITIWGACGTEIGAYGIVHVYVVGSTVTDWVSWETDNKSGSAGLGSLFGWIFGVTGQAGMNVAKGTSGPAERFTVVFEGWREPVPEKKAE